MRKSEAFGSPTGREARMMRLPWGMGVPPTLVRSLLGGYPLQASLATTRLAEQRLSYGTQADTEGIASRASMSWARSFRSRLSETIRPFGRSNDIFSNIDKY